MAGRQWKAEVVVKQVNDTPLRLEGGVDPRGNRGKSAAHAFQLRFEGRIEFRPSIVIAHECIFARARLRRPKLYSYVRNRPFSWAWQFLLGRRQEIA